MLLWLPGQAGSLTYISAVVPCLDISDLTLTEPKVVDSFIPHDCQFRQNGFGPANDPAGR
jgi:hypothetical protein